METAFIDDLTGKQFGPYQIVAPLDKGGMATVYKAYQPGMERYVAVKVLPQYFAHDPHLAGRFLQEAKVLAKLQHPHILPIFDFGQAGHYTYIVMPFIKNGTLADWLQGQPLPLPEILRVITQVADALDYAHGQGLIHRDVKPSNILMDERGNCLLSDFGIVKLLEGSASFTTTSGTVGTPRYMSPEQGLGEPLDRRSDVYSLGVILYELSTGQAPFDAETPMALMFKQVNTPPTTPRQINPDLPVAIEAVILKALAKNPDDRYATTVEMAQALQSAIPDAAAPGAALGNEARVMDFVPTLELPPSNKLPQPPASRLTRLRPAAWAAQIFGIGGLVVVVGFVGWWILRSQNSAVSQTPTHTRVAQIVAPTNTLADTLTASPTPTPTSAPTRPAPTRTVLPSPTALPTLGAGVTQTASIDGMTQVYVPAGEFLMGSVVSADTNALSDEKPRRPVTLGAFWLDSTEVTNAMYAVCVESGVCSAPGQENSATRTYYYTDTEYAKHPVIFVSWYDARAYCTWAGRRLPTEAEWEKAARGTQGQLYPWGNIDLPPDASLLNFDNRNGDTSRVGSYIFGASPYGAMDMAGNVWEWVADWYRNGYYKDSPDANPTGPETGSLKVFRGGAWDEPGWLVRAATRASGDPQEGYPDVGFRCAADAP
jgi:serine/threonine-protein kinase